MFLIYLLKFNPYLNDRNWFTISCENNIYTKLIKHTHTHTSLKYGIIGGIISNPLLYLIGLINPIGFAGLLTTGLITKSIISVSGFGLGWNLNYSK